MSEIALRTDNGVVANHIPDAALGLVQWAQSASAAYELAQRIITTSFAPAQYRGKPDEAAAAMLAGAEVGLSPMASLRAFDVIQGSAAPRAIALRAILQSMGHRIRYPEMTPTRVVAVGLRLGDTEWQKVEWTIKRAQELGLTNKEQWKKQPQTMLVARATSEVARLIAADAILGIPYTVEELQDSIPEPTTTVTRQPTASRTVRRQQPEPIPEPALDEAPEPDVIEPDVPILTNEPGAYEGITKPQLTKLHILFKERGFVNREDALGYLSLIGLPVESSKDLSKAAAHAAIEALEALERPAS